MARHESFAKYTTSSLARMLTASATTYCILIVNVFITNINEASVAAEVAYSLQCASPAHSFASLQSASHKATQVGDLFTTDKARHLLLGGTFPASTWARRR